MIPNQSHILEVIKTNSRWENWYPYVKGLTFQETQERRVKDRETEALSFMVAKSMEKSAASNGEEFALDVWRYCAAELSKLNWHNVNGEAKYGPRGGLKVKWVISPVAIWKRIYRNASLKVQKEIGFRSIGQAAQEATKELLDKAFERAGMNEVFS